MLQNVYLCISTYNRLTVARLKINVVNCFKMCIFALARTTFSSFWLICTSCELLQNVYLCISTYNYINYLLFALFVVNCFKMCIFALARTTKFVKIRKLICCELLQNVYLCISTYNFGAKETSTELVVNCFKMCIFALARTTEHAYQ